MNRSHSKGQALQIQQLFFATEPLYEGISCK
jgi:hypothetical protein